jgi:hypothetical protein
MPFVFLTDQDCSLLLRQTFCCLHARNALHWGFVNQNLRNNSKSSQRLKVFTITQKSSQQLKIFITTWWKGLSTNGDYALDIEILRTMTPLENAIRILN